MTTTNRARPRWFLQASQDAWIGVLVVGIFFWVPAQVLLMASDLGNALTWVGMSICIMPPVLLGWLLLQFHIERQLNPNGTVKARFQNWASTVSRRTWIAAVVAGAFLWVPLHLTLVKWGDPRFGAAIDILEASFVVMPIILVLWAIIHFRVLEPLDQGNRHWPFEEKKEVD